MVAKCPVCGKMFDVLWPQLWRYKENKRYICTWKCLRQLRKEEMEMAKMKKDGTPAKKPGPKPKKVENPESVVKGPVTPDELYVKFGSDGWTPFPNVETPENPKLKLDGAITIQAKDVGAVTVETPEGEFCKPAITTKPCLNYRIRAVETDLGTYSADGEYFEFKSSQHKSDAIEMEIDDFIRLAEELPKVMKILGVTV